MRIERYRAPEGLPPVLDLHLEAGDFPEGVAFRHRRESRDEWDLTAKDIVLVQMRRDDGLWRNLLVTSCVGYETYAFVDEEDRADADAWEYFDSEESLAMAVLDWCRRNVEA